MNPKGQKESLESRCSGTMFQLGSHLDYTLVTGLRHSGALVCFRSGIGIVADNVGTAVTIIALREQPFTLSAEKTQSFLVSFGIFGSHDHSLLIAINQFLCFFYDNSGGSIKMFKNQEMFY